VVLEGTSPMSNPPSSRRRPSVHITLQRAARLHRLVRYLAEQPQTRDAILSQLGLGLRTFYRELELLKRCGVKVRHRSKQYTLMSTAEQAEGRLPFPDPQLSFAEMAELATCPCEAGRRLAELLASVINQPPAAKRRAPGRGRKSRDA
jgi:predicted DNA-binding transcriptional regulator YafY